MIATPAYDGTVCVHYADSLAGSIKLAAAAGVELFSVYWPGEALVQHARNMLVKLAIDAQVDDLVWIDADQGWRPEELLRLLAHEVDVVGGTAPKKSDVEQYPVGASSIVIDHATRLMLVDVLGTGFLRLSRAALEAVWALSEPYTDKGNATRMVCAVGVANGELVGEDMSLCAKLQRAGFRIHLDTTITCSHTGSKTYTGDFAAWLKRYSASRQSA